MQTRLILFWRHAQAVDGSEYMLDMARPLTKKGMAQAQSIAKWLRSNPFPTSINDIQILCSPATRALQTVQTLKHPYTVRSELSPGANHDAVLKLIETINGDVLLVGHEPWMSQAIASLLQVSPDLIEVKKGSLWAIASQQKSSAQCALTTTARTKYQLLCAQLPIAD